MDGDVRPAGPAAVILLAPVGHGRPDIPDGGAKVGRADHGSVAAVHVDHVELLAGLGPAPDDDGAPLLVPRPVRVICA